ncbi:hypothetical protein M231_05650 [Tremella mesenterica]|uniref:Multiple myeloma tumor-associated protein 2-like N-terminal domain-containing protein n=1 Tax=Tremella mesenterica TaxID=5217 RepID=A0A4Q1BHI9_TREME|nr:hypothetical protein M231_05650 [Tremella mesenterica]
MYDGPVRDGNRGGHGDFRWSAIVDDKHRENYLGSTVNAPQGRWQKNKDIHWYARDVQDTAEQKATRKREEIAKLKAAEEDALAAALGFAPRKLDDEGEGTGANGVVVRGKGDEELDKAAKEERRKEKELRKEHRALKRAERELEKEERRRLKEDRRARDKDEDRHRHKRRDWDSDDSPHARSRGEERHRHRDNRYDSDDGTDRRRKRDETGYDSRDRSRERRPREERRRHSPSPRRRSRSPR